MDACAICGRPARYVALFPISGAGGGVVYDGASVCSRACGLKLQARQAEPRSASEDGDKDGSDKGE